MEGGKAQDEDPGIQAEVSVICSPMNGSGEAETAPVVISTKVAPPWLGSLFGTRNGFTHFGAVGMKVPVFGCE